MGVSTAIGKAIDWFRSLSETHPFSAISLLVIAIGAVSIFIGADAGVPYTDIRIPDAPGRYALMLSGAAFAIIGLLLMWRSDPTVSIKPSKYDFKITQPSHGDAVDPKYTIKGTYKIKPPTGYCVYIVELDPSNGRYRPRKEVILDNSGRWRAVNVWSSTTPNRELTSIVMLVGKNGKALTDYYDMVDTDRPAIRALTNDFFECDRVDLKTKGEASAREQSGRSTATAGRRKKKR